MWSGDFKPSPPSPHRQTKIENRPVSQLAGDAEASAVGFHDGFADGQSHSGSVDLHALVSSAVELFEDEGLLEIVDAGAAVGNVDGEHLVVVLGFGGDAYRGTGG